MTTAAAPLDGAANWVTIELAPSPAVSAQQAARGKNGKSKRFPVRHETSPLNDGAEAAPSTNLAPQRTPKPAHAHARPYRASVMVFIFPVRKPTRFRDPPVSLGPPPDQADASDSRRAREPKVNHGGCVTASALLGFEQHPGVS